MSTEQFNLTLRQAVESDSESLLEWRNDATTKAFSLIGDEVTRAQHEAWFNKTLQDKNCLLIIGEVLGDPVGMVRINILSDSGLGQVSINLNPDFRGKGISKILLSNALSIASNEFKEVKGFVAEIHIANSTSRRIFEALGFEKQESEMPVYFEDYLLERNKK